MLGVTRCVEVEDGSFIYIDPAVNLTWPDTAAMVGTSRKLRTLHYDQNHIVTRDQADALVKDGYAYPIGGRLFEQPELCEAVFGWDLSTELDFIATHISDPTGIRGIEFGCGTGRVLRPLNQRGFELDGVDISEPGVRWLQSKVIEDAQSSQRESPTIFMADISSFSALNRYGYAIAALNTLRYLPSWASLRRHLHMAALSVRSGGVYLVMVDTRTESSEPTPDGSEGRWTINGDDGRSYTVAWSKERTDPASMMDLERVIIAEDDTEILREYQTQLSMPVDGWQKVFTESGEWEVASVHFDSPEGPVKLDDFASELNGNFWFVLRRTETTAAPMLTY
ncbi:class I SAM-dependent methyltransferase [Natronoglycomyces albus]|uniref:Methyltransferase domain-containing protein n=1 Tax=Natronoglycomyces albus TaxID=2811108 RepID=A0A895XLB4_9ACTN|nr:methyltransferase domain-containing protein [Natronoglycomyces albus]QSB04343.1 methyltransferase domain-containing protein [Natronoglycomyces albus]